MLYNKMIEIFNSLIHTKKDVDGISEEYIIASELPFLDEIKSFTSTRMWKYVHDTLAFRIKSARDDMEDQNADIETLRVMQGRIEELRFIETLPDFLIANYDNLKAEISANKETNAKDVKSHKEVV